MKGKMRYSRKADKDKPVPSYGGIYWQYSAEIDRTGYIDKMFKSFYISMRRQIACLKYLSSSGVKGETVVRLETNDAGRQLVIAYLERRKCSDANVVYSFALNFVYNRAITYIAARRLKTATRCFVAEFNSRRQSN